MLPELKIKLIDFFLEKNFIKIAYLFGSYALNKYCSQSDIDILIYTEEKEKINSLIFELEKLLKINVDLVLINEAPATVIWSAIRKGIPLKISDRNFFLDIMLNTSREAEDFIDFTLNYYSLKQQRKVYAK